MKSGYVNTDQLRGLGEDAKALCDEAADRIETLETDNADLRDELERLREENKDLDQEVRRLSP